MRKILLILLLVSALTAQAAFVGGASEVGNGKNTGGPPVPGPIPPELPGPPRLPTLAAWIETTFDDGRSQRGTAFDLVVMLKSKATFDNVTVNLNVSTVENEGWQEQLHLHRGSESVKQILTDGLLLIRIAMYVHKTNYSIDTLRFRSLSVANHEFSAAEIELPDHPSVLID